MLQKIPFYEKIKMTTKGPFVVESFVTIGSFDCDYANLLPYLLHTLHYVAHFCLTSYSQKNEFHTTRIKTPSIILQTLLVVLQTSYSLPLPCSHHIMHFHVNNSQLNQNTMFRHIHSTCFIMHAPSSPFFQSTLPLTISFNHFLLTQTY